MTEYYNRLQTIADRRAKEIKQVLHQKPSGTNLYEMATKLCLRNYARNNEELLDLTCMIENRLMEN